MERLIFKRLEQWRLGATRKPLILLGARQVGKTFSLREFGVQKFERVHEFNFQSTPSLRRIFSRDLRPQQILRELEFESDQSISPRGEHLVFFDEIQDCPEALTSLKYFFEDMPSLPIVAAGSLLGLHLASGSFPVGKVDLLPMQPLSFAEFVKASSPLREWETFQEASFNTSVLSLTAHERLWATFKSYLVTGGLPESVTAWMAKGGSRGGHKAFSASREKLSTLIVSYVADIAKHAGKVNAMHIERVWRAVPSQLARAVDESTSRFKFKDVVPGASSYRELSGPIDWLAKAGMVLRIPICHSAQSPIAAFTKENIFKLYMFDCGILSALLGIPPRTILDYEFGTYKGFFVENFVAQELTATAPSSAFGIPLHAWSEGRAEIEFLLESTQGAIPIEVKSGNKIRSKSLKSFVERYQPKASAILSARTPARDPHNKTINLPLYLAGTLWQNLVDAD